MLITCKHSIICQKCFFFVNINVNTKHLVTKSAVNEVNVELFHIDLPCRKILHKNKCWNPWLMLLFTSFM